MIVVADTSPLNYLNLLGQIDLLHVLYGRILVPHAVLDKNTRSTPRIGCSTAPNFARLTPKLR
jgi:predicted nucleic acid-binding protein